MADSDYMTNHSNFLGSNDIGKEIQLFDTNLDLASSETKKIAEDKGEDYQDGCFKLAE